MPIFASNTVNNLQGTNRDIAVANAAFDAAQKAAAHTTATITETTVIAPALETTTPSSATLPSAADLDKISEDIKAYTDTAIKEASAEIPVATQTPVVATVVTPLVTTEAVTETVNSSLTNYVSLDTFNTLLERVNAFDTRKSNKI